MKKITLSLFALLMCLRSFALVEPDSIYIDNSIQMGACENSQSIVSQEAGDPNRIEIYGSIYGSFDEFDTYKVIISDASGSFANADTMNGYAVFVDTSSNYFMLSFHLTGAVCINCYKIKVYVSNMNYTSPASFISWSIFPKPGPILVQWPSYLEMALSTCTQDSVTFCAQVTDTIYPSGTIGWYDMSFGGLGTGSCYTTYDGVAYVRYAEMTTDVGCYSEVLLDYSPGYFETPTITFTNGTLNCDLVNYSHQWFLDGVAIQGATQANYVPLVNGNYYVQTTLGSCVNNSNTIAVLINSISSSTTNLSNVYPNPFSNELNIWACEGESLCTLYNALGERVIQQEINPNLNHIQTQSLMPGMYHIVLVGTTGNKHVSFIKNN